MAILITHICSDIGFYMSFYMFACLNPTALLTGTDIVLKSLKLAPFGSVPIFSYFFVACPWTKRSGVSASAEIALSCNFPQAARATKSSRHFFKASKSAFNSSGLGNSTGASPGWECSYVEYFVIISSKYLQSASVI